MSDRLAEIEKMMADNDFWNNKDYALSIIREYESLSAPNVSSANMPVSGVIIGLYAGAGGDDSEDFVRMLYEMYMQYAHRNNWYIQEIDSNQADHGGYRSVQFRITHPSAYALLRYESGVHRLIRISPFNAKGKRQTSFALVEVLPDLPPRIGVDIKKEDLEIAFARSGGPGGQNVNKRETAVRLTHVPSGLTVHVDGQRTQEANRDMALQMLRGKLALVQEAKIADTLGTYKIGGTIENEWGNQIRTYTLHPYQLVKDHRTNIEIRDISRVLERGDIDALTEPLRV